MKNKTPEVFFERYKPYIPDWNGFLESVSRPLHTNFWLNPLKCRELEELKPFLPRAVSIDEFKPIAFQQNAFKTTQEANLLTTSKAYQIGMIHFQEEVSMLPVFLMNLEPGDEVLELCAAPGNKTLQAASIVGQKGFVLANEKISARIRGLRAQITRHGATNIAVHKQDAMQALNIGPYPRKIIADVPCSCEGTIRKNPSVLQNSEEPRNDFALRILHQAIKQAPIQAEIMYSTCTFRPEENEQVLDEMLKIHDIQIEPISIANFEYSKGLSEFENLKFQTDVRNAIRIWPHQNNTGGFFIAKIRKIA